MHNLDEWHDFVRLIALLVNIFSLYLLARRYRSGHKEWNSKTVDLWYALVMWTVAGVVFSAQGILLDRPFTPGFAFLTAASLVTGKGLFTKGGWGNPHA